MDTSSQRKDQSRFETLGARRYELLNQAKNLGPVDPKEDIEVTLLIRRPSIKQEFEKFITPRSLDSTPLSREAFAASYSTHQDDLNVVKEFANTNHLVIKDVRPEAGTIKLSGKATDLNQAFNIQLEHFEHPQFKFRSHKTSITIPTHLEDIVEAVFGLDNRPQLKPHFQIFKEEHGLSRANAQGQSFNPNTVASLYNFPEASNLNEVCIGIIELGGGYKEQDLQDYFSSLGIQAPTVTSVSVDGATNSPSGNPNSADGEVVLDIEVAGAVAPGVKIAVYFAPNTDAGFLNVIKTAIHDTENKPSVLSISWGSAEANWTEQAMKAMDQAFQDAATLGVTICCAAGDQGSSDGANDGNVHVDFPASSPHVLACGGTKLVASNNRITEEVVWDESSTSATGGGISEVFALPDWQKSFNVPPSANKGGKIGRGVPDVAGDADPATGYNVLVDGQTITVGGTSAVAPLWAGLIAIMNQKLGKPVGYLNPTIYNTQIQTTAFHDITQGTNDNVRVRKAYPAKAGWDACTGLGTPNGTQLVNEIQKQMSQN
ncbi:S53 family peptidase [Pullulanibacillus sp. KACC 23026]|uniref:S53 family peptidase n=1 Tax=Pullulanibacillus sp. KACC 23026 TaxID=3028315 RepID=UPI0023AFB741|nr:S53 family peptidase [Pullulanibacillus sp. KACC 23026]WEG10982.1 S53 family peptidase [Pullulanibacillus sp. KACC 23026]